METGIRNKIGMTVCEADTAKAMGSGDLDVLATPAMLALMERTAAESVKPHLEEGKTTVGTRVDVSHISATPVGMKVTCESELVAIDGRKLAFRVSVCDERGPIGEGTHERFIVDRVKFRARTYAK